MCTSYHFWEISKTPTYIYGYIFFFIWILGVGVHTGSTWHCGHLLAYCTCPGWLWGWRSWSNERFWQEKPKYSEKTCPRRHFVHHKSHLPDPGANPGRRGGKPATNRFSYDAMYVWIFEGLGFAGSRRREEICWHFAIINLSLQWRGWLSRINWSPVWTWPHQFTNAVWLT
jgi:hypothetical protein